MGFGRGPATVSGCASCCPSSPSWPLRARRAAPHRATRPPLAGRRGLLSGASRARAAATRPREARPGRAAPRPAALARARAPAERLVPRARLAARRRGGQAGKGGGVSGAGGTAGQSGGAAGSPPAPDYCGAIAGAVTATGSGLGCFVPTNRVDDVCGPECGTPTVSYFCSGASVPPAAAGECASVKNNAGGIEHCCSVAVCVRKGGCSASRGYFACPSGVTPSGKGCAPYKDAGQPDEYCCDDD